MNEVVSINKYIAEKDESPPLEVTHSASGREKHLEGLSEDQKKTIRLIANIFVQSVLNIFKK